MIKTWLITGDTHADNRRFESIKDDYTPSETAIIILGDSGVNFFRNKRDIRTKEELKNYGFRFYMVRGNHDSRPEDVPDMIEIYDQNVKNFIYMEPEYPSIRYFKDGGIYEINGLKTLIIGGAYSVDKYYRLEMHWTWHENEQLTLEEMKNIQNKIYGENFDLVLTHTCPLSWQPTDLFLIGLDQNTVDNFMERTFDDIRKKINWKVWLFGHYHADRIERPGVEQFYRAIEDLNDIWCRWNENKELEWWRRKGPNYKKEDI